MKKLLLMLLLAAAGLQGRAEDLYIVGNAIALDAYVWGGDRSPYKLNETGSGTNIYKWTGFLKKGDFKICTGLETWDAYHPKSENQSENFEISEVPQEITTDGTNDRKWLVVNPGFFEVTVDLSQTTKTVVFTPQWTDISTAEQLIAFAESVNSAEESNHNGAKWARLTADINMSGKTFPGIGRDNKWTRYHGTFDGQGHKIYNLEMTTDYCGFVTVAGGGCTVKNLLIDNTCSFSGNGRNAALISCCNYSDFGIPVTIESCGNEANVTGTANNCAGLLGCNYGNGIKVTIKNSFNAGNISSTGSESAPISGWLGSNARVENTYNIGYIEEGRSNNSFARWDGSGSSYENCYSTLSWGNSITGKTLGYDINNVTSGLFCYTLNGSTSGGEAWRQTLPTDTHPYPGVFAGHNKVYANGETHCDGTPKEGATVTYSNTEGENRDDHNYVDGFCSYCHTIDVTYLTPVDGFYEINNMNKLHWFSQYVNAGNPTANAKLTADIAMESDNELGYTPIGSTSHPYTGHFDGQEHSVTLRINNPGYDYQGLFGVVTDGVLIEKVIVKGSVTGKNYVGGIVGGTNGGSNHDKLTTIQYCGNEATITANGANGAGIVGVNIEGQASINIANCYNAGNVTSGSDGAAISGWLGGGWSSVSNTYNIGTVKNGTNASTAFGRNNGCGFTDCYYSESSRTSTDGNPLMVEDSKITSGEFCHILHRKNECWRQNLTGTVDAYPVPITSHSIVYANTTYTCYGEPKGEVHYANNNDERHDAHQEDTDGFCSVCNSVITFNDNYMTPVDGCYEISTSRQLCWFAAKVNTDDPNVNARLMNDINMENIYLYTPIGKDPSNKYNGTFDGQGFRIKNLSIDTDVKEQGLFSVCNGATIKNLIMDASCTIKSTGVTNAAFVAVCNGSGTLTFENCGNEATVTGNRNNNAAFLAYNWVAGANLTVSFRNCYNIGEVSGGWDNCAFIGWNNGSTATFDNCWNIGTIENVNGDGNNWARGGTSKTLTNCYSTNSTYKFDGALKEVTSAQVADGTLCAKVGFGFRQNIGEGGDAHPNFDKTHGFVAQIGEAGYSTMYNVYSDVTIPSGVEAFAGVVNGSSLSLVAIENKIAASEPVILKGTAGLYNFIPTTGASKAANNSLKGSNGSVTGGEGIYALAKKGDPAVVGFYPVGSSVKIPEGKAYLKITSGEAPVKGFYGFDDDDATGIGLTPAISSREGEIYNLAGQRINKMQKGINIINGKKILK